MLSKVKATAVFKSVLKAAINSGSGIRYPMDYVYNNKHWQICLDGFRLYIIPKTIPDEEFELLPTDETEPFEVNNLKKTFDDAWYFGELANKGKIKVADLRYAVKQAKASCEYNQVIELTPDLAVTHYAHKEKGKSKPEYNRVVFMLKNHVAVPAEQLIQALDLFKDASIYISKWNYPLFIHNENENAFALIMPMGRNFWEDMEHGIFNK